MSAEVIQHDDIYLCEQLKLFKMVYIHEHYQEIIDEAINEKLGYKDTFRKN